MDGRILTANAVELWITRLILIGVPLAMVWLYDGFLVGATHRLRKRDAFVFILLICAYLAYLLNGNPPGWDFPAFYVAGKVPLRSLYNIEVFRAGGEGLAAQGVKYIPPYVRPAVFAVPLKALALLPFRTALWLWMSAGLCAYAIAMWLLFRRFSLVGVLLPAFAIFFPAILGIQMGQDSTIYLLALTVVLLLLLDGHDLAAGIVLGFCCYKFNLMFFIPPLLFIHRRWKVLNSWILVSVLLAISSMILAPASEYLAMIHNIPNLTTYYRTGGVRGVLLAFGMPGLYLPFFLAGSGLTLYCMTRCKLAEGYALAVVACLALAYHSGYYDYVLLALPMVVVWSDMNTWGAWNRRFLLAWLLLPGLWSFRLGPFSQVVAIVAVGIQIWKQAKHEREAVALTATAVNS
jgi:hypothetical protein